jgi:2,4-dienoyl-CoA reductase-like NADH-dependent reductase (Old Yellow Enzyme family)
LQINYYMAQLFSPISFRNITLKNRIVVSPMCQYSSEDGFANDWHLVHLGSRATGGAGLVFSEATAVSPEGRISPQDLGIWKDEHIAELKKITNFIKSQGSVAGIQLSHAGRKASHQRPWDGGKCIPIADGGWQTIAPSPIPFIEEDTVPAEMSKEQIAEVVSQFRDAAKRSLDAGFEVIEIHGAHGYLINEFLSPLGNKRTDEYGGSFENRTRFLLEVITAVKEVWPDTLPVFLRISASDWVEGGWTVADSQQLAELLTNKDIDLIDCSSGGMVSHAKITAGPSYQVPFAEAVRKNTKMQTGAVGIIVTGAQAEEIISSGKADLVFLAREFLRDAYFPMHAAQELGAHLTWPKQYERAKRS